MVRQFPHLGDFVATRAHDQGGADNLHGAVLVARRGEPPQSEATDLSNVVPFARPRRQAAAAVFPLASVGADDRPAPFVTKWGIGRGIALLAGSLALHGALLAMFWQDTRPMAGIGVEVISVEITLGGPTAAGLAQTPNERDAQVASQAAEETPPEEPATEQSRVATVMPQEVPVGPQETAPELQPQETPPEAQPDELKPQEQQATLAETAAQPVEKPPEQAQPPRPQVQAVQKAPERKRIAAPTEKKAAQKKQRTAAVDSEAGSGVGRGRSDRLENYAGIVRAHLVRYKQMPSGARGNGVATVSFTLDGNGRVTSARLAGSSGVPAFDQEAVAMARRASPFPPPKDSKANSFTVPVRFEVR
ncbi:MAG TPA: energy transducer TonB [Xanthobacteraceae bacterium]|nr:energy transducer TonB [Xanthobacteraceae bacterium]